ncbi:MAG TPA: hypothetical protein VND93_26060 [Myxococcales bacterium]|nr:hypothetical protein [Myxococcales bacterium]
MRTIIELVGRDRLGSGHRTFRQTLVELQARFGLSQVELDRMKELLDEANAVLHEGKKHTRRVHEEMLALLEHFLQSVYLLPRKLAPTG